MKPTRIAIAALTLSAAGFAGLVLQEGYTDKAVVPTLGDRPTVGFGATFREDGSPVQMGDTITPQKAIARSQAHIAKDETGLKGCMAGAELRQEEYDLLVDFAYQYGVYATCRSSMVRHVMAGEYEAACHAYILYKRAAGRDCSLPENWGPRGCKGVWTRSLKRRDDCLAAQ